MDELIWKYSSVFLAQPFEAAKLLLQVRAQDDLGGLATTSPLAAPAPVSTKAPFKSPWNEDVCVCVLAHPLNLPALAHELVSRFTCLDR